MNCRKCGGSYSRGFPYCPYCGKKTPRPYKRKAPLSSVTRRASLSSLRTQRVPRVPDPVKIQKQSFRWFKRTGLKEAFGKVSPIADHSGNITLEFYYHYFEKPPVGEDTTRKEYGHYEAPLFVKTWLINHEVGEIKEQDVLLAYIPMMTKAKTFIWDGTEIIVAPQLIPPPGIYFDCYTDGYTRINHMKQKGFSPCFA